MKCSRLSACDSTVSFLCLFRNIWGFIVCQTVFLAKDTEVNKTNNEIKMGEKMCTCVCMYACVYEREREKEREIEWMKKKNPETLNRTKCLCLGNDFKWPLWWLYTYAKIWIMWRSLLCKEPVLPLGTRTSLNKEITSIRFKSRYGLMLEAP